MSFLNLNNQQQVTIRTLNNQTTNKQQMCLPAKTPTFIVSPCFYSIIRAQQSRCDYHFCMKIEAID
ncbi:hypothetical protein [Kamptonema formosum]|uniref:hypothetical protein n=1 Tax=Kamptonema formosum TaxID=331992 RepID=UPI0002E7F2AB|nr:hypothetical protein [Kamptonema formosum]